MFDPDTINTINAEERKMTLEGAYEVNHMDDVLKLDAEQAFDDILNGKITVDGFIGDPFGAATAFVEELEDRWVGEETSPYWDRLRSEEEVHLALVGYMPVA